MMRLLIFCAIIVLKPKALKRSKFVLGTKSLAPLRGTTNFRLVEEFGAKSFKTFQIRSRDEVPRTTAWHHEF